ncbi:BOX elements [hydrothermal vent metagenome]|uniref:BOX elements n=1 Tax=hydrothermal vent metagenome TaxID=652676 RepID=A0A1W1B8V3_9ZZZZ
MKLIKADYIYIDGKYLKDYAIAFEKDIISVAPYIEMRDRYPQATLIETDENSIIYPGFINTHVHLEFSANKTTLRYGSFMDWLYSVIESRESLMGDCDIETMSSACEDMLKSGVTTIGAISSMGLDMEVSIATPQRVVYFNEIVGSNPQSVDALYDDFINRFESSSGHEEDRVIPAIAIHSPYALHPIVLDRAIQLAKDRGVLLTAHLLESPAEREWLDRGDGDFKEFFSSFFNQHKPNISIDEFLSKFDGHPTHFAHAVQAQDSELEKISKEGHSIAHCPRSNRLLGCGKLDIDRLDRFEIPYSVATDGLSSNNSLKIFDELRSALMIHDNMKLKTLANRLIRAVTKDAGEILRLPIGSIEANYKADLAVVTLPQKPSSSEDLALWTILHTDNVSWLYIDGERVI